jgi:hypothetical protein
MPFLAPAVNLTDLVAREPGGAVDDLVPIQLSHLRLTYLAANGVERVHQIGQPGHGQRAQA